MRLRPYSRRSAAAPVVGHLDLERRAQAADAGTCAGDRRAAEGVPERRRGHGFLTWVPRMEAAVHRQADAPIEARPLASAASSIAGRASTVCCRDAERPEPSPSWRSTIAPGASREMTRARWSRPLVRLCRTPLRPRRTLGSRTARRLGSAKGCEHRAEAGTTAREERRSPRAQRSRWLRSVGGPRLATRTRAVRGRPRGMRARARHRAPRPRSRDGPEPPGRGRRTSRGARVGRAAR